MFQRRRVGLSDSNFGRNCSFSAAIELATGEFFRETTFSIRMPSTMA